MHVISTTGDAPATRPRLDREKWLSPRAAIVVTHHDYSDHLEDALLSLLDQSYDNWECVVIDDASDRGHALAAETIVRRIASPKIRFHALQENVGQIQAFFAGLDAIKGEFVCLLDPDDRYAENFIEEALRAHLNAAVYAPIVCTDQFIVHDGAVITGTYSHFNMRHAAGGVVPSEIPPDLHYVMPRARGWHWTSTSAMMFRRPALDLMRPHKRLPYPGSADSYLAQGAHLLGGSLFLNRPLVYRLAHGSNAWLTSGVFASTQNKRRADGTAEERSRDCLIDVVEAIRANGGGEHLQAEKPRKRFWRRKLRSIEKRWLRWTGRVPSPAA